MYDLVVMGGGPAGLTATIYAVRKRLNVLLVTKDLGGKTGYQLHLPFIHDYQVVRGVEVVDKFRRELEYLDFVRLMDSVKKVEREGDGTFRVETGEGKELRTKSVIVATGARGKFLEVPGERDFMMRGLCYSAVSYAHFFLDKTVVVVGDAGLALRAAAELSTLATHVYLVAPVGHVLDSLLGKKLAEAPNVTVLDGYTPVAVMGKQYAEQIRVKAPDGEEQDLDADGIFVELDLLPQSQIVASLVELDEQGRIKVDARNCTSAPGIFAAGDVTDTYAEQALVAVGEGAKAALSAYEYLLPAL